MKLSSHSVPLLLSATALPLLFATAGCQRTNQPEYAPVANFEVRYDEALALREFPRTPAYYGNGDVIAGPTNVHREFDIGDPAQAGYAGRRRGAIIQEPLIALGNLVLLPYYLVKDPPWEQRRYEGTIIPPTYTAAVPYSEVQGETAAGRRAMAQDAAARDQQRTEEPGERSLPGQRDGTQSPGMNRPQGSGTGGTGGTGGGGAGGGGR